MRVHERTNGESDDSCDDTHVLTSQNTMDVLCSGSEGGSSDADVASTFTMKKRCYMLINKDLYLSYTSILC